MPASDITHAHLLYLQDQLDRRAARLQKVLRYYAQLNAFPDGYNDVQIDRTTRSLETARQRLAETQQQIRDLVSSRAVKPIIVEDIKTEETGRIVVAANKELLTFLSKNPKYLHTLNGHVFADVIGGIFSDLGYSVEMCPLTHDGGKDLIIRNDGPLGSFTTYVQCKRQTPFTAVSIDIVRNAHSVLMNDRVNKSIIVTTSHFSREAVALAEDYSLLISLKEYNDVVAWLRRYCR